MLRSILRARFLTVLVLGLAVLASGLLPALGTSSADRAGPAAGARTAQAQQPVCPPEGLTRVPNGQLRMPPAAKPGGTRLLVAVMSGGDGDADDYLKLGATANREGIAVLYPTGRAGSIWQIAASFGSSDVKLVSDVLDRVLATGCFDPNRISITGVSNGAGFATRMACKLPDRFAAVVAIAAGYRALDPCPTTRASFLAIHGSADTIVPYNGKRPDRAGSVPRYTARWARRDGCDAQPRTTTPRRLVTRLRYAGCDAGLRVELLRLSGTDHGWPGAGPPLPDHNPSGLSATRELLRFIATARKPAE
jgi:polyhydroxybutyrate depolymerase